MEKTFIVMVDKARNIKDITDYSQDSMIGFPELKTVSQKFVLDLNGFGKYLFPVIESISNPLGLIIKDMKFLCKREPILDDNNMSGTLISILSECGVGFFDYILMTKYKRYYENLGENARKELIKPQWIVSPERRSFNDANYERALFYLYFILMTRAKVRLNDDESLPKFITNYIGLTCDPSEIYEMLGDLNFERVDHKWIRSISIGALPKPVRQRLVSGFAGTRLIAALVHNYPDKDLIGNEKYFKIYDIIIAQFKYLYWELHPFFTPENMQNISLSKNLLNLMTFLYSKEMLEEMCKKKVIYSVPKFDQRYTHFESWNSETFSTYQTRLSGKIFKAKNNNKTPKKVSNDNNDNEKRSPNDVISDLSSKDKNFDSSETGEKK